MNVKSVQHKPTKREVMAGLRVVLDLGEECSGWREIRLGVINVRAAGSLSANNMVITFMSLNITSPLAPLLDGTTHLSRETVAKHGKKGQKPSR